MSGSDSRSMREMVVLPAPDGEERTIRRPRRRRVGGSSEWSMAALASGEPWPSSDGMVRRTKTALKLCGAPLIVQCSKTEESNGRRNPQASGSRDRSPGEDRRSRGRQRRDARQGERQGGEARARRGPAQDGAQGRCREDHEDHQPARQGCPPEDPNRRAQECRSPAED